MRFESNYLNALAATVKKVSDSASNRPFMTLVGNIINLMEFSKDNNLKINFRFDDSLESLTCGLTDVRVGKRTHAEIERVREKIEHNPEDDKKRGMVYFFRKKQIERDALAEKRSDDFFAFITTKTLNRLTEVMGTVIQSLRDPFAAIQRDYPLYKLGLSLTAYYKKAKTPCGFPEILPPGGKTDIKPLTVVKEKDDAANTQYIRDVALTQILAQAGLPVQAETTRVAAVTGIFAQFASDEVVLGRFEEEAKVTAEIFNQIEPYGLVFFHEIYQSTAYEEVSEPFAGIIETLNELKCTVFLVTHNHFLTERLIP
jgi:hypothetical protein